jgi:hypothetical protein
MKRAAKKIVLSAVTIFCCMAAFAVSSGNVQGHIIIKETKEALGFAEITFESRYDKMTFETDSNGIYYANHLPTGRYTVSVTYNNRTFVMTNIRVYDSYTYEVNMPVSNKEDLPAKVIVPYTEPMINTLEPNNNVMITETGRTPQNFSDVLNAQPGMEVKDGRLFIKGSDQVKYYIDGTPVMVRPVLTGGL